MLAVAQRVVKAAVTMKDTGDRRAIDGGLAILLAVGHDDNQATASYMADKIVGLRIFDDDDGKMNKSLLDNPDNGVLVVSQFTLLGDTRKGRRPSYIAAAAPSVAEPLYRYFVDLIKKTVRRVATGEFGADMLVELHNDGPVTLIIESPPLQLGSNR
jgi:D-tyrosyl-tRNA(Tyr) deacylase